MGYATFGCAAWVAMCKCEGWGRGVMNAAAGRVKVRVQGLVTGIILTSSLPCFELCPFKTTMTVQMLLQFMSLCNPTLHPHSPHTSQPAAV